MVEKATALWLIILTIITCAAVPVFMILLTSPHPSEFILIAEGNFFDIKYDYHLANLEFGPS